ncbi:hypothetical protein RHECNPAF_4300017 [Rhizobium etli CNPAF512]|nr:hypothetical protein RHECNPAF_4300017 [Rhizobium etli CNPAF512]
MIEPELPGDDFQRLAMGQGNIAVGKGLPQSLCHELGIAKVAHMSSFRWRQTGRSVPASADPFAIDRQTARDVKADIGMHSP